MPRIGLFCRPAFQKVRPRPLRMFFALAAALIAAQASADSGTVSVGPASATASSVGPGLINFPITLSNALVSDVNVALSTSDGSAVAGTDYVAFTGSVTIPAGATTTHLSVNLNPGANQPDKQFSLTAQSVTASPPLVSFAVKSPVPAGTEPASEVVADFNGDGLPDVAVADLAGNAVIVLINTTARGAATTTFASPVSIPVGAQPLSLVVADFDNDGKPDLAVANSGGNTVTVLHNVTVPGSTTAQFAVGATITTGTSPTAIAAGDLDIDGRPDLVVATASDLKLTVYRNTSVYGASTLNFTAAGAGSIDSAALGIGLADMNLDGRLDVVVASFGAGSGNGDITVLLNQPGRGANIILASDDHFPVSGNPSAITLADLDGDGRPDIALTDYTHGRIDVFQNQTLAGTYTPVLGTEQHFIVGAQPYAIVSADFDRDGKPDLAISNLPDGSVSVLQNNSIGNVIGFLPQNVLNVGTGSAGIGVGDFNHDGTLDVATSNVASGTVTLALNTSTFFSVAVPTFASPVDFPLGTSPSGLVAVDLNRDSVPDIAAADDVTQSAPAVINTTAAGAATPSFGPVAVASAGALSSAIAAADFSGEREPSLIVANYSSNTVTITPEQTIAFANVPTFENLGVTTLHTGNGPQALAVADFNGDGTIDIAVANRTDGTIQVFGNVSYGNGFAVLDFSSVTLLTCSTPIIAIAIGDLNGDGKPDIVGVSPTASGPQACVFMNTSPRPSGPTSMAFSTATNIPVSGFGTIAIADLNGDGKPDIITGGEGNMGVNVNQTPFGGLVPAFGPPITTAVFGTDYQGSAVADFNGDGRPDIVFADEINGAVAVVQNSTAPGSATVSLRAPISITVRSGPGTTAVTTADLNRDGRPDIIAASPSGSTMQVIMNTSSNLSTVSIGTATGVGTIHYSAAATSVTPSSLTFGSTTIGSTSGQQSVTLQNTGAATLSIANISTVGDFAESTTCGASLGPAGTCTISVSFTPTATGNRSGMLSISSNSPTSPNTVSLAGVGAQATSGGGGGGGTSGGGGGGSADILSLLALAAASALRRVPRHARRPGDTRFRLPLAGRLIVTHSKRSS